MNLSEVKIIVKSGGDIASGVAWRLHQCGMRVLITEIPRPLAVRRTVSFCEAVYTKEAVVEGVRACLIDDGSKAQEVWGRGDIPVLVDPDCRVRDRVKPLAVVDAILAKENSGTSKDDAPLVIALGPGFTAGVDAHYVVETNRGHHLGRLLPEGGAEPNTGKPGAVMGITLDRVLRAPDDGEWRNTLNIGDFVKKGDQIGAVNGIPVKAAVDGVIRGMIHPGIPVRKGLKIGDIDPRGIREHCFSISEKALAISGGVLEGILRFLREY
ncbi:MAG: selenium-dependent molybdenum cofactor biosynthesis protein YqeB [Pseudomonadota bacterium]